MQNDFLPLSATIFSPALQNALTKEATVKHVKVNTIIFFIVIILKYDYGRATIMKRGLTDSIA